MRLKKLLEPKKLAIISMVSLFLSLLMSLVFSIFSILLYLYIIIYLRIIIFAKRKNTKILNTILVIVSVITFILTLISFLEGSLLFSVKISCIPMFIYSITLAVTTFGIMLKRKLPYKIICYISILSTLIPIVMGIYATLDIGLSFLGILPFLGLIIGSIGSSSFAIFMYQYSKSIE